MGGLTNARDHSGGASLAACQRGAILPVPVAVAIRIVSDAARSLDQLHGGLSPETLLVRLDGLTEVIEATSARADSVTRSAYLAPEQVTAGEVDRRADVFALGVILWELLTGARLFDRGTATETRIAIAEDPVLDARDVNPEIPVEIAGVVRTALERRREERFSSATAFSAALANARTSSGLADARYADVLEWVAECIPALRGVAASPAPDSPVVSAEAVPDLDLGGPARTRSGAQMGAVRAPVPATNPPVSAPPSSAKILSGSPIAPPLAGGGPGGRSVAFDANDDDDFDMEIERNLSGPGMPAVGLHSSGLHTATRTASGRPRVAGTGLELGAPSRMAREEAASRDYDGPSLGAKLAGYAVAGIVMGGAGFALFRFVHRAGGVDVTRFAAHAFDGSSAPESGAFALVTLVVAIAIGFVGLRLKPHSWALVASGGAALLLALAMVTVTLASTGENPTPPDGVLLVPFLLPAAVLLLGLGIGGRAARLFTRGGAARRVGSVPLAAIAAVMVFAAFEISRLAR